MYYTKNNIMNIDFSKYKRFIAFGCSFTRWRWASWSDCLSHEMPDAVYVNTARPGAGNPYISIMLNRMFRKYMFDEETLVGICWSTFYRDDTFNLQMPGQGIGWLTPGNIYSSDYWPKEYIEKRDPHYFMMRDCATIAQTIDWLRSQRFDSFSFMGMSLRDQNKISDIDIELRKNEPEITEEITFTNMMYSDLDKNTLGHLYNWEDDDSFPTTHEPYKTANGELFHDYHPRANEYIRWMEHCNVPLTDLSRGYALWSDEQFINSQEEIKWAEQGWYWPDHEDPNDERNMWEDFLDQSQ